MRWLAVLASIRWKVLYWALAGLAGLLAAGLAGTGPARSAAPLVPTPTSPPSTPPPACGLGWRIVSSPNPGSYESLYGVAKVTANDVWAVGSYSGGSLTEHWDGSSWSVVPSSNPGGNTFLTGVAAVAANDVWAVGDYGTNPLYPVIEHWNGSNWSVVPGAQGYLTGIAAVASNNVWAVGYSGSQTLVEHWDGSSWSVVPSPGCCRLNGVAAVAANDVWAVGTGNYPLTLTEHWDGSSWSIVPSPSPGTYWSGFDGVAAVAANDVWAAGSDSEGTLTEHWNGSSWTQVPSPSHGYLYGVAAVGTNDVWAVGHDQDLSTGYNHTLAEHWDGSSWSVVPSPYLQNNSELDGVAVVAAHDVWAVGYGGALSGGITLIEHYSDPCAGSVTPTNTPTRTGTPTATATATCPPAGPPGPWTSRASYPLMLTDIAVASDGTTLYAFGGRNGSGRHSQAYKYNYATDSWTALASFPYDAIAETEADYGYNGKIYLFWGTGTYIYDIATDSWSLGAPPPQSELRYGHAYWNGKIYVIGGYVNNAINAVYAYDIATDSWSTLAPLPQAEGLVASAAINGKIYVANGQPGAGLTNNLYIYDIATDTWTQGPSSPLASSDPGGTAIGGELYMIGGQTSNGPTSNTYIYDPATASWSQGPSLNVARQGGNAATINTAGGQTALVVGGLGAPVWFNSVEASTAPLVSCATATPSSPPTATNTPTRTSTPPASATVTCPPAGTPGPWTSRANYPWNFSDIAVASDGSTIYGFGGFGGGSEYTQAYVYSYVSNGWSAIANLPNATMGAAAEYGQNGKFYVMLYSGNGATLVYDIATNSWSSAAPPPTAGIWSGHAYWNGKVYLIGGGTRPPSSAVYAYDISSNTWSTLAPLPQAESGMASGVINGKIYVANGNTGGSPTNNLYIYDIATNTWSQGASSPHATDLPASTVIGGKLYMIGGNPTGSGWGYTSETYLYDPASDSWSQGPSLNVARGRANATTINTAGGQTAVVVGGWGAGWLNSVEASTAPNVPCATPSATPPATATVGATFTPTRPPTNTPPSTTTPRPPTATPGGPTTTPRPLTATPGAATATATACAISFSDVHPTDYFYAPVQYLYCHGVISGYGDNTFRPYNNTTRAQMVKIVVLGFGIAVQTPAGGAYTFHDVPPAAPFFDVIETAAAHNIVAGYNCGPGGPGPCDAQHRPYFLPNSAVTRGQLAKIDVVAAGWPLLTPPAPTFTDVPPGSPFYGFVETAVCHGVVSGYADHTFRPGATATRGQISKIVYLSLTTSASCPSAPGP